MMSGAVRMICAGFAFVWRRHPLRIALIAVVVAMPLLLGGWWLARHSSLTAVEHVQIEGLAASGTGTGTTGTGTTGAGATGAGTTGVGAGASAGAIEAALRSAARGMSTLAVNTAALRRAVAQYPIVRSVGAHASFPHGLRIELVEQPPVAALVVGGARTAVAADGVVLGPGYLSSSLPLVDVAGWSSAGRPFGASSPASGAPATGSSAVESTTGSATTTGGGASTIRGAAVRLAAAAPPAAGVSVRGAALLQALSILGAGPSQLAQAVSRVYMGPQGLTVVLRGGLLAYFGDATRAHAKWIALTRVLADPSSAGAVYIDVRVPERPAAGFAPETARPDLASTEAEPPTPMDQATAAELAAGLNAAVSGDDTAAATGDASATSSSATSLGVTSSSATSASSAPSGSVAGADTSAGETAPGSASTAESGSTPQTEPAAAAWGGGGAG